MPKRAATGRTYTAGRAISIGGTAYAVGATIPNAALKGLRKLDTLLSRRWVVPSSETYVIRKASGRLRKPKPSHVNAQERTNL